MRPSFTEGLSQRMHVKMFPFSRQFSHETSKNVGKQPINFRLCNFPQVLADQSSITGRVQPSLVSLETNQTTRCLLILTSQQASRGNTSKLETLTVTAVAQSDTVNIKNVTLFDIQVSVLSETQPTTPPLKQIRLEAVAPNNHQSIKPGARLEVNFTVTNLAVTETFTFDVSFLSGMLVLVGTRLLLGLTLKLFHLYTWPCGLIRSFLAMWSKNPK